jgi:hypothetical protein
LKGFRQLPAVGADTIHARCAQLVIARRVGVTLA